MRQSAAKALSRLRPILLPVSADTPAAAAAAAAARTSADASTAAACAAAALHRSSSAEISAAAAASPLQQCCASRLTDGVSDSCSGNEDAGRVAADVRLTTWQEAGTPCYGGQAGLTWRPDPLVMTRHARRLALVAGSDLWHGRKQQVHHTNQQKQLQHQQQLQMHRVYGQRQLHLFHENCKTFSFGASAATSSAAIAASCAGAAEPSVAAAGLHTAASSAMRVQLQAEARSTDDGSPSSPPSSSADTSASEGTSGMALEEAASAEASVKSVESDGTSTVSSLTPSQLYEEMAKAIAQDQFVHAKNTFVTWLKVNCPVPSPATPAASDDSTAAAVVAGESSTSSNSSGSSSVPDVATWNLALHAMRRAGDRMDAMQAVVGRMEARGVKPNLATYNLLLRAALREDDGARAMAVLESMRGRGLKLDAESYNILVTLAATNRRVGTALRLAQEAMEAGFMPARDTFNAILMACARSHRSRNALAILRELEVHNVHVPIQTLGEVLQSAAEEMEPECALAALKAIGVRRHSLDLGLCLLVLNTAAATAHVELLEQMWQMLGSTVQNRGPRRSDADRQPRIGYHHLTFPPLHLARIHTYAATRDIPRAVQSIAELESVLDSRPPVPERPRKPLRLWEGGGRADEGSVGEDERDEEGSVVLEPLRGVDEEPREELLSPFSSLRPLTLAVSSSLDTLDNSYYVMEDMYRQGRRVPQAALNCVVAGCAALRDVHRAELTVTEMARTFNMQPDVNTYTALIIAHGQTREGEKAGELFDKLKAEGIQPTSQTYHALADAHITSFNPAYALAAINDMVDVGITPSRDLLVRLLLRSLRQGYEDGVERAQQLITGLRYRSPENADLPRLRILLSITRDRQTDTRPEREGRRFQRSY